jgi:uncharacterized protein (TIGR02646 family)
MRVFATRTPATVDCLALWDDEVSGARQLSKDEIITVLLIRRRVEALYKKAAAPLLDALGSFCAYCEVPLTGAIDVEHMIPKSEYPTFALEWENFVAACGACNIRKRANPSRQVVQGWLGTQIATPAEYQEEIRQNRYRWPDIDDTYRLLDYGLEYKDQSGAWTACQASGAVDAGNQHVTSSVVDAEVCADLPSLGLTAVPVRVVVADRTDDRAADMIRLCGLDHPARPGRPADRRSMHRTEAWFRAVQAWHEEVPNPASPPVALRSTFLASAAASGFYSVWLTVAELIAQPLASLFVAQAQSNFPGTDRSRLP